jgi:hypothetical protein
MFRSGTRVPTRIGPTLLPLVERAMLPLADLAGKISKAT